MEKDYSLLRPFNLEAAKAGNQLIGTGCFEGQEGRYIAGPGKLGEIVLEWDKFGFSITTGLNDLHGGAVMAPLAWVEGKPVYKGDTLWHKHMQSFVVDGMYNDGTPPLSFSAVGFEGGMYVSLCAWTPPKVKREGWVNVYPGPIVGRVIYDSEIQAKFHDENTPRIACARIEWEE